MVRRIAARRTAAEARIATTWFVYMLECERGVIYTGIALDVAARFEKHCRGTGAAFTRINPPRRVLAARRCGSRSAALKLEASLKRLPRPEKLAWAARWPARDRF